jgi:phage anti-repressor protein
VTSGEVRRSSNEDVKVVVNTPTPPFWFVWLDGYTAVNPLIIQEYAGYKINNVLNVVVQNADWIVTYSIENIASTPSLQNNSFSINASWEISFQENVTSNVIGQMKIKAIDSKWNQISQIIDFKIINNG